MLAEIPDFFGRGMTAQMTYYETAGGARVRGRGASTSPPRIHLDPVISRVVDNLWN